MTPQAESYYLRHDSTHFESTIHAQGAWNPHEQHMAPVAGILAHVLEAFEAREGLRIARISYEILGLIPAGDFEIVASVVRPGRTIELVQAELSAGGRVAVRATAWRLQISDTSEVEGIVDQRMPGRELAGEPVNLSEWPGGYIQSIEARALSEHVAGSGRVWLRTPYPLLADEPVSDFARLTGLVDTSNGIATRVKPGAGGYAFPNVDLQVHLYRLPAGEWLGLENAVNFGSDGIGLTSTVLHDERGPFGRAEQILTLRKV
ncbi:thioesterase family protein [Salinibacterium sp. NSLL150]|uniref:thioesterase family protein n=1 Tax=unclassified Salinibacterium TaxID=2632331 RepID=UPI0018CD969C|nr:MULTISPECIES: thioesterase family protein [unclassified Salinibacterium]MBH0099285.1 thioesterase family protein [Salinibacterium sp. NSLL35]MBH0102039.1 thioesterase family protein [Salinibacterium sp. NSLL150]MBH0104799.1 thioesterase family protein [Salinibacterium sp. NSLL16]MBH0107559.1 thioesterase family protein [Salinibacterium sp. NSLL17]